MSSHSFPKIDQKEYLKRYLSGNKVKRKKKEKRHKKSSVEDFVKVKVIDDDTNNLEYGLEIDEELLLTGEDAPQIVGEYIEEIPADRKVPKWKSIVIKDEPEDESDATRNNADDLCRLQSRAVRIKQELTISKTQLNRSSDNSSQKSKQRKRKSCSASPPRRRRKSSTPTRKLKSPLRNRKINESTYRSQKIKTEPQSPIYGKSGTVSDQSPPRKRRHSPSSDHLPLRRRRYSNQSPSPIRDNKSSKISKNHAFYKSPETRRKDSDQSPPRKSKYLNKSPTRRRNSFDLHNSPVINNRSITSIQSPSRRRHRRDSDQSPQRKKRISPDEFSKNRHRRETPANSPPRKYRKTPDKSPPRRRRYSDQSPQNIKKKYSPDYRKRTPDQSPLRRRKNSSPHRIKREKRSPDLSPQPRHSRWEKHKLEKSQSPPPTHKPKPSKTLEGKKSGLQDAKSLQKETKERRYQEDLLLETMSSEISGRNAEVQVRLTGRKGRRAREAAEEDPEERRLQEEQEKKKKLQYDRWGKGLKQIEDHKNRMIEQEYESSKPLARYSNDEDLERYLKEQERAEDPMLQYMRQKRKAKEKQSGKPQVPRYEGPYPENRFGIRPGYRWDGVDRSNGYEKKYFAVQNEKQARQDEAYKYSVEDM